MNIILHIIEIYIGVLLSFLGFIVWHYSVVDILSAYDMNKTVDKHGLAKWVGSNFMIMGVFSILVAVTSIISSFYLNVSISILPFIPVYFILIIRTAIGCKKFESKFKFEL